jgi:hypothetical protein
VSCGRRPGVPPAAAEAARHSREEAAMIPMFELLIDPKRDELKDYDLHLRVDAPSLCRLVFDFAQAFALKDVPDGETSSGHPKYRRVSLDEAVEQAFALHEKVLMGMLKRGMAVEIPSTDELKKKDEKKISAGFVRSATAA